MWTLGAGAYLVWVTLLMPHQPGKFLVSVAVQTREDCVTMTELIAQTLNHDYEAICFEPSGRDIASTSRGPVRRK